MCSKQLFPRPRACGTGCARGVHVGPGCGGDGYSGRVYRGSTTQPAREEPNEEVPTGGSLLPWVLGVLGGGNDCSGVRRRGRVCTTLRARSVPPGALPVHTLRNAASGPIVRELRSFLGNLVKTAKCHQKCLKRPTIVPISKTGSRIHLLIFPGFRFCQPSLTRN